ncbi:MAG: histidine phosphatase family protein [Deltaproteobacteria bacterium]|nr:histidine phosphatase family protein [Deltaproteobacteria bacterium]
MSNSLNVEKSSAAGPGSSSRREPDQMGAGRTRLYLARHGELVTSHEWRYVGHLDVALNDKGRAQIARLARRLSMEKIDVLLSSDLMRTVESAWIIGAAIGLEPAAEPAFREIHLGQWEGLTREEITERFTQEFDLRSADIAGYRIQGGESFADLRDRVIPRLTACLDEHQGRNVLLVAHGGVNRIILCHALGLDLNMLPRIDQAYGCLNIIDFFDGVPVVHLMNETPFD